MTADLKTTIAKWVEPHDLREVELPTGEIVTTHADDKDRYYVICPSTGVRLYIVWG